MSSHHDDSTESQLPVRESDGAKRFDPSEGDGEPMTENVSGEAITSSHNNASSMNAESGDDLRGYAAKGKPEVSLKSHDATDEEGDTLRQTVETCAPTTTSSMSGVPDNSSEMQLQVCAMLHDSSERGDGTPLEVSGGNSGTSDTHIANVQSVDDVSGTATEGKHDDISEFGLQRHTRNNERPSSSEKGEIGGTAETYTQTDNVIHDKDISDLVEMSGDDVLLKPDSNDYSSVTRFDEEEISENDADPIHNGNDTTVQTFESCAHPTTSSIPGEPNISSETQIQVCATHHDSSGREDEEGSGGNIVNVQGVDDLYGTATEGKSDDISEPFGLQRHTANDKRQSSGEAGETGGTAETYTHRDNDKYDNDISAVVELSDDDVLLQADSNDYSSATKFEAKDKSEDNADLRHNGNEVVADEWREKLGRLENAISKIVEEHVAKQQFQHEISSDLAAHKQCVTEMLSIHKQTMTGEFDSLKRWCEELSDKEEGIKHNLLELERRLKNEVYDMIASKHSDTTAVTAEIDLGNEDSAHTFGNNSEELEQQMKNQLAISTQTLNEQIQTFEQNERKLVDIREAYEREFGDHRSTFLHDLQQRFDGLRTTLEQELSEHSYTTTASTFEASLANYKETIRQEVTQKLADREEQIEQTLRNHRTNIEKELVTQIEALEQKVADSQALTERRLVDMSMKIERGFQEQLANFTTKTFIKITDPRTTVESMQDGSYDDAVDEIATNFGRSQLTPQTENATLSMTAVIMERILHTIDELRDTIKTDADCRMGEWQGRMKVKFGDRIGKVEQQMAVRFDEVHKTMNEIEVSVGQTNGHIQNCSDELRREDVQNRERIDELEHNFNHMFADQRTGFGRELDQQKDRNEELRDRLDEDVGNVTRLVNERVTESRQEFNNRLDAIELRQRQASGTASATMWMLLMTIGYIVSALMVFFLLLNNAEPNDQSVLVSIRIFNDNASVVAVASLENDKNVSFVDSGHRNESVGIDHDDNEQTVENLLHEARTVVVDAATSTDDVANVGSVDATMDRNETQRESDQAVEQAGESPILDRGAATEESNANIDHVTDDGLHAERMEREQGDEIESDICEVGKVGCRVKDKDSQDSVVSDSVGTEVADVENTDKTRNGELEQNRQDTHERFREL